MTKPLNQQSNVPVFYHVPRNAGTYTVSIFFNYLRYYITDHLRVLRRYPTYVTPRNVIIRDKNVELARFLGYDPNNFCGKSNKFEKGLEEDKTHFYIELSDLNPSVLSHVCVFALIIESDGFRIHEEICKCFKEYNLKKFIILRDPIQRMLSFFNYINSDISSHEPTYDVIPKDLSGYINSHYIEDSWLIRQLANVCDNEAITDDHYNVACDLLSEFEITDISETDKFLTIFFEKHLGLPRELSAASETYIIKNKSYDTFPELCDEDKKTLLERVKYETRLYNKLVT